MIVEIHGAGCKNKGAELMLRATASELRGRLRDLEGAVDPAYGPRAWRRQLDLRDMFPSRSHVGTPGWSRRFRFQRIFARLGGRWLSPHGGVTLASVDALVDIAGFAYTDEWGSRPTKNFAALSRYYKSQKKPVILLPQAFGPFWRSESKAAFAEVLDHAAVVFARDPVSYGHAVELATDPDKVQLAPDITLFYPRQSPLPEVRDARYACIVPNVRLVDQGARFWHDKYEQCLAHAAKELVAYGIPVRVLVYDTGGDDLYIALRLQQRVASAAVEIETEQDPAALKRLIGRSLLVVGSRYHSLVAAFANAVPCVGIGWSHKYQMLFKDFGCERFVLSHLSPLEVLSAHIAKLADATSNAEHRTRIAASLEAMRLDNERMWERVTTTLARPSCQA
jgi:polysaccharide pyruvyl transferase WcaK-like protein